MSAAWNRSRLQIPVPKLERRKINVQNLGCVLGLKPRETGHTGEKSVKINVKKS